MTLRLKVPDWESIFLGVATCKSLIGHVEERVMLLLLDDVADLPPLLLRRVNTSRIVCAGVQKNDAALRGGLEIFHHTIKVQTDGILVVVSILDDLQTRVLEDSVMICPARCWYVDFLARRVVTRQELAANPKGASARNGLGYCDLIIGNRIGVGTIGENSCSFSERRYTRDSRIFLVECRVNDFLLSCPHRG